MANAIWSKDGESFFETDDTPEYQEQAKSKNYTRYYDITKDDTNVYRVTADRLEEAKGKGYKIFGQPAIEQKPVETPTKTAPIAKEKPAEEPGLTEQAADWVGRTAKAGVKSLAGIPAGVYELGKEVLTQPQEAIPAALTGTAKTFGVEKVAGALRGGYEAGKSLLGLGGVEAELEGGDLGEAYKRGYEAEVSGLEERAKRAKDVSPAAYAAGPYAATAAITGGAGLPATLAAETATGAAQQYAETGKIDTAELAGQTLAGLGLTKGVQKAGQLAERVSPVKVTQAGREAAVGRLEEAAIKQAQEKGAIGDIAKKYTGEEGVAKIQEAKRAGYEVGQIKTQLDKLIADSEAQRATRVEEATRINDERKRQHAVELAVKQENYNKLLEEYNAETPLKQQRNDQKIAEYNAQLEAAEADIKRAVQADEEASKKYAIDVAEYNRQHEQAIQKFKEDKTKHDVTFPEWHQQDQANRANNARIEQENAMAMTEYRANVKQAVSKSIAQSAENLKNLKTKVKSEAITTVGDELRNMLQSMDSITQDAYKNRKSVAQSDIETIPNVEDSATLKGIKAVERELNSVYGMDDITREKLKSIQMDVDQQFQTQPVTRGTDFEALQDLRKTVDNLHADIKNSNYRQNMEGKAVTKENIQKQQALYKARQQIQQLLYGSESPFSLELKTVGEAADRTFSEFKEARNLLLQKDVLAREKAVPGLKRDFEPKSKLIESYFDELDQTRKKEIRSTLQDYGVNIEKIDMVEKMMRSGNLSEMAAVNAVLPQRPALQPRIALQVKPVEPQLKDYTSGLVKPAKPIPAFRPSIPAKPVKEIITKPPKFVAPPEPELMPVPGRREISPAEQGLEAKLAEQKGLAQEYKALGGVSTFTPEGIPLSIQDLKTRFGETVSEKVGIGLTPMQLLERAAEIRGSRSLVEKVQAAFPDNPALNTAVKSIVNTGTKITPALVRAVARKSNVDEEKLAKAIVESKTP